MKSVAVALMLAAVLAGQIALAGRDGPVLLLAPAAVILGVVAASALQGEVTWLSVMAGASSPLALTWLNQISTTVAISAMCALWLAPRLWLARSRSELLQLLVVSLGAATLAALVVGHFVAAVPLYHFTSCVFAGGSLALAAVVLPTDTVMASSLQSAARLLEGPVHDALLGAAESHRQRARSGSSEIKETEWPKLSKLVDQRLGLATASGRDAEARRGELDAQIIELSRSIGPTATETAPEQDETPTAETKKEQPESQGEKESEAEPEEPEKEPSAAAAVEEPTRSVEVPRPVAEVPSAPDQ